MMNKYYRILGKILKCGKPQSNKKVNIRYLPNLGNVHIYEINIERTKLLLAGDDDVKFDLNA